VIGQQAGSQCPRVAVNRSATGAEALGTIQIVQWGQLFVRDKTVEIENFGKAQFGSYPIHLHEAKDLTNTPPPINANSVHHSYNEPASGFWIVPKDSTKDTPTCPITTP